MVALFLEDIMHHYCSQHLVAEAYGFNATLHPNSHRQDTANQGVVVSKARSQVFALLLRQTVTDSHRQDAANQGVVVSRARSQVFALLLREDWIKGA